MTSTLMRLALFIACAGYASGPQQPRVYANYPGTAARSPVACTPIPNLPVPRGTSLVLAAQSTAPNTAGAIRLCRYSSSRSPVPLYRPLPTGDIDIAADGRLVAYRDSQYRVHLVEIAASTDRILGLGVEPRFSHDGRYLAYVTGDSLPLPKSPERLVVYALATKKSVPVGPLTLPRVGDTWNVDSTLLAWSPRADALAWFDMGTAKSGVTVATFIGGTAFRLATVISAKLGSWLAWTPDGSGVLYWSAAGFKTVKGEPEADFNLVRQAVPGGATTVLVAAAPTRWIEGIAPAPVPSPDGTLFASLLGEPSGGYDLVTLFARGRHRRTINLPVAPSLARFSPSGAQLVVAGSHASLIDVPTGHVHDLGPAVAAFWAESRQLT